jgi:cytochrome P450
MLVINHWALHNDPEQWPDVTAFRPERFLDDTGKLGPKPESWLPFSAGRRVCLGEAVAKPELLLIFACLMQKFTIKVPDGTKVDLSPAGGAFGVIPQKYKVLFEERK